MKDGKILAQGRRKYQETKICDLADSEVKAPKLQQFKW